MAGLFCDVNLHDVNTTIVEDVSVVLFNAKKAVFWVVSSQVKLNMMNKFD